MFNSFELIFVCNIIVQFYYFPHGYLVFPAPLAEGTIHSIYIYIYMEWIVHIYMHIMGSCMYSCVLSHIWFLVTPWAIAHQASPFLGFSRQEYWSGLSFPTPGDFHWQADSLPLFPMLKICWLYMWILFFGCLLYSVGLCVFFFLNQDGVFWLL